MNWLQQSPAFQFVHPQGEMRRSWVTTSALPALAQAAVDEVAAIFNVQPHLGLFGTTAAMAIAAQSNVDVIRPGGGSMPTSEMLLYIGPSTSKKSLILRNFLSAVTEIDKEFAPKHEQVLAEYKIRLKRWTKEFETLIAEIESERSAGREISACLESNVTAYRSAKPKPPRNVRFIVNEATRAGLLRTSGNWPWGSIVSHEGTKTLDHLLLDSGFVNTFLDGDSIERDTGNGTQRMVNPRGSIILITHPEAFKCSLELHREGSTDNGLLPRASAFAPLEVPQPRDQYSAIQPDLPNLAKFNARIREMLLCSLEEKLDGTFSQRVLRLSPSAEVAWLTYARELKAATAQGNCLHHVPAAAARSAEKALRRAARDHFFIDESGDHISEVTIRNAISIELGLLGDWCVLLGPAPEEPIEIQCARALHKTLHEHLQRGGMTSFKASWLQPRASVLVRKQPHYDMAVMVLAHRGMLAIEQVFETRKATRIIHLNANAILSISPSYWV